MIKIENKGQHPHIHTQTPNPLDIGLLSTVFRFFLKKGLSHLRKDLYLFYVSECCCLQLCLCTTCVLDAHRGQKTAPDPLELASHVFVGYQERARN